MIRKRQENLVTVGLTLCVAILALLAAFVGEREVSTARCKHGMETSVIAREAGILSDAALTVITVDDMPELIPRYAAITISEDERQEIAGIIVLEAGNQCARGQQAVAEVILNRVISPEFPDTVHDVLHQDEDTTVPQFSTISNLTAA